MNTIFKEKDGFYSIKLPAFIFERKDLSFRQKLVWQVIRGDGDKILDCHLQNKEIGNILDLYHGYVSITITKLRRLRLIEDTSQKYQPRVLRALEPTT